MAVRQTQAQALASTARPSSLILTDWKCFQGAEVPLPRSGLLFIVGQNNVGKTLLASALAQPVAASNGNGDILISWSTEMPSMTPRGQDGRMPCLDAEVEALHFAIEASKLRAVAATLVGGSGDERYETLRRTPTDPGLLVQSRTAGNLTVTPYLSTEFVQEISQYVARFPPGYLMPSNRPESPAEAAVNVVGKLQPNGVNLANVMLFLRNSEPSRWERFASAITEVLGQDLELTPSLASSKVSIRVGSADGLSIRELGSGVEQTLMVAAACEVGLEQATVVVDEPEAGLHPSAQVRLVEQMRSWATDRLIVIVTHSAAVLGGRQPGEPVHLVEQDRAGKSTVRQVDTSLHAALTALGVSPIEAIGVRGALLVEGPSDVSALVALFPELRSNPWFAVIDAGGSSRVGTFHEALQKYEQFEPWSLIDNDEGSSVTDGRKIVLPCRDLENILLDFPTEIASYLSDLSNCVVTPDSVERQIEAAVEDLRERTAYLHARSSLASKDLRRALNLREPSSAGKSSREKLLAAVQSLRALVPTTETANSAWDVAEEQVNGEWTAKKRLLAPGSTVLELVFEANGCAYRKTRDAGSIFLLVRQSGRTSALLDELRSALKPLLDSM